MLFVTHKGAINSPERDGRPIRLLLVSTFDVTTLVANQGQVPNTSPDVEDVVLKV
ncbi:hypothetical protein D9M70_652290 [compost metagenome]